MVRTILCKYYGRCLNIGYSSDYPDNVAYCDKQTESVVGFKCPAPHELPANAVARRFLPFPRFPKPGDETAYIVVS